MSLPTRHIQGGYLLILTLVFGSIFFVILGGFIGYVVTESRVVEQRYQFERAGEIAEAGLNYYRWYLAHYPGDVTAGTGAPGPYVFTYNDPEDGPIGEFSLEIASTTYCNRVASVDVTSTGYTFAEPAVQRTFTARYAQPTVADYAFIINSSVWAGPDRQIFGPYHSNQGIRMDGANFSTVTSGLTSWTCTSSFGCSGNPTVDGVFTTTANANPLLFAFPSAPINFTDLTLDLAAIRDSAQNDGGIYIPPSGVYGYRVTFNSNGTVSIRRVTNVYPNQGLEPGGSQETEYNIIRSTTNYGTFAIDDACPLIYVDDKIWLEGTLDDRVTIAAAGTDSFGDDPNIILQGNITYNNPADDGLLAIAEDSVLLGIDVPDNMVLNGIFVAQNGRFGRNLYYQSWLPNPSGPLNYRPFYERNSLTMTGTVVSNGRVGTQWVDSGGGFVSGFRNRFNSFDRNLVDNPPPLVPNTSDVYEFVEWREQQ